MSYAVYACKSLTKLHVLFTAGSSRTGGASAQPSVMPVRIPYLREMPSFVKNNTVYGKDEAKKLKERFWTTFGQYMAAVPSAEGEKINWVNYKTGIKHLFFRMDADHSRAEVFVEIVHPDEGIRHLMYEQFVELKAVFESALDEEWTWYDDYYDEKGKVSSRIVARIDKVRVFSRGDWPALISFFKPRIMALDEFWSTAKYAFDIFR